MGMLMHHTWLEEQKKAEKPVAEKQVTEEVTKGTEPETAKKTSSRRKK